jgi:hypothetical protein
MAVEAGDPVTRMTTAFHRGSIALMAAAVLVATGDGFAQSYAGLYHWAVEHGLTGWKAQSFPLMVDLFIAVGELGLFALALEGHRVSRRVMPWVDMLLPGSIAAAGWTVSLLFNVGAVEQDLSTQLTAAVAPVASMLGLLVLLRTLHRLVGQTDENAPEPVAIPSPDSVREDTAGEETVADLPPVPESVGTTDPEVAGLVATAPGPVAIAGPAENGQPSEPVTEPAVQVGPDPDEDPLVPTARDRFADVLATGDLPSVNAVRRALSVGHPRATRIRASLNGHHH